LQNSSVPIYLTTDTDKTIIGIKHTKVGKGLHQIQYWPHGLIKMRAMGRSNAQVKVAKTTTMIMGCGMFYHIPTPQIIPAPLKPVLSDSAIFFT